MSDTAWNWVALGATVVLFAGFGLSEYQEESGDSASAC